MLPSTLALVQELQLDGLMTPRRFGGSELGWRAFYEVTRAVSAACPSSGWCVGFFAYHAYLLALFSPEAQQEVWGVDPTARLATSLAPFGQIERADGGYRVRGRWPWCSGIDHCSWVILGGLVPPAEAGSFPHLRLFLLPTSEAVIEDDWHVAGLRGSGSNTTTVTDLFVPEHRTLAADDMREGNTVGSRASDNPIHRQPQVAASPLSLAVPAVGAALGAMNETLAAMRQKMARQPMLQDAIGPRVRLAEACDTVRWADSLLREIAVESETLGPEVTLEYRADCRYRYARAVRLAVSACDTFLELAGASANYDSSPIQRYWRDAHAIAAHALLGIERAGDLRGRSLLGMPRNPKDGLF